MRLVVCTSKALNPLKMVVMTNEQDMHIAAISDGMNGPLPFDLVRGNFWYEYMPSGEWLERWMGEQLLQQWMGPLSCIWHSIYFTTFSFIISFQFFLFFFLLQRRPPMLFKKSLPSYRPFFFFLKKKTKTCRGEQVVGIELVGKPPWVYDGWMRCVWRLVERLWNATRCRPWRVYG